MFLSGDRCISHIWKFLGLQQMDRPLAGVADNIATRHSRWHSADELIAWLAGYAGHQHL